jgi:serine/threonine-protein kinase
MYQLLSGQLPFPADNFGALVLQIATGTPLPLRELVPGLPVGAPEIVAKAMAREPEDRFQDLRELIAALEDVARGGVPLLGAPAPNPSLAATLERPRATPASGLTYPPNGPSAVPPPLPSQRTPSGEQLMAAQRTPSGAQSQSAAEPGAARLMQPGAKPVQRLWPYAAAAAVLIAVSLVLALVWRTQPQAATAEKRPAHAESVHVAEPAAAETTASAATQPVVTAIAPVAVPSATGDMTAAETDEEAKPAAAAPPQATGSAARAKRASHQPPAAAPAQTTASASASPAEPAPPPATVDKNPLHMKLQ